MTFYFILFFFFMKKKSNTNVDESFTHHESGPLAASPIGHGREKSACGAAPPKQLVHFCLPVRVVTQVLIKLRRGWEGQLGESVQFGEAEKREERVGFGLSANTNDE